MGDFSARARSWVIYVAVMGFAWILSGWERISISESLLAFKREEHLDFRGGSVKVCDNTLLVMFYIT